MSPINVHLTDLISQFDGELGAATGLDKITEAQRRANLVELGIGVDVVRPKVMRALGGFTKSDQPESRSGRRAPRALAGSCRQRERDRAW